MSDEVTESMLTAMLALEGKMAQVPGVLYGDAACPLVHSYGEGCYIRQITMPKGMLLTSKIHRKRHPYFILSGDVSVMTLDGHVERLKAPFSGITEPGTKRMLYIHEETIWITVHVTDKTDLLEIEEEIIETPMEVNLCHGLLQHS